METPLPHVISKSLREPLRGALRYPGKEPSFVKDFDFPMHGERD